MKNLKSFYHNQFFILEKLLSYGGGFVVLQGVFFDLRNLLLKELFGNWKTSPDFMLVKDGLFAEQVVKVREFLRKVPVGDYKVVYIIVNNLTSAIQDRILKMVEEPGKNFVLFECDFYDSWLDTLKSRVIPVFFPVLSMKSLIEVGYTISEALSVKIGHTASYIKTMQVSPLPEIRFKALFLSAFSTTKDKKFLRREYNLYNYASGLLPYKVREWLEKEV